MIGESVRSLVGLVVGCKYLEIDVIVRCQKLNFVKMVFALKIFK